LIDDLFLISMSKASLCMTVEILRRLFMEGG